HNPNTTIVCSWWSRDRQSEPSRGTTGTNARPVEKSERGTNEARSMTEDNRHTSLPPFPPHYRASGVLLHVTSLPSPYGVGDVGPMAMRWIDLLHEAGQSWWQSLPLGPTGYGNSPYQPLSSFAGNSLLISPDWLIEEGLLRRSDCDISWCSETRVDFDK